MNKWGLTGTAWTANDEIRFGLRPILEGTAHKPFVYRQLAPMIANAADKLTPESVKFRARQLLMPIQMRDWLVSPPAMDLRFRYLVIHQMSFFALFGSLFLLRRMLLDLGVDGLAAVLAPAAFVLALPYIQTVGGFYYDTIELLTMSAAVLLAIRGRLLLLLLLALPATLNKETFIFFALTLYPLLRHRRGRMPAAATAAAIVIVAGLINVALKLRFAGSGSGGVAEVHILSNLGFYLNPLNYLKTLELTYGIIGPARVFIGSLLVAAIVVARGWEAAPVLVKRHLLLAGLINLPLFVLFCAPGELRNLSLLYVGLVVMIGFAISKHGRRDAGASAGHH